MSFTPPRTYPDSVTHIPINQVTPEMIPLMPTVALAFFSLCCSAFVILRIILSILPRRYLGRRVYPLMFSPSSHYLPPADKSYVWLALCDVLAVSVFVWESFSQWVDASTGAGASTTAFGAGSAARLWLALTFRQTCFLVVSALILVHVHLRKSVSFGCVHWFLWVPFALLASISTMAVILVAHHTTTTVTSRRRFLIGYVAYSYAIAILNTVMFGSLVGSLITIRRSLANFSQVHASEESKSLRQFVEKPQVSLATRDIDAVREGGSWITSPASSRRRRAESGSPYSHSTTSTRATQSKATSPERDQAATAPFPFWPSQGTRSSASHRTPPSSRSPSHTYEKTDFGPVHRYRTQSLRAAAATAAAMTLSSQGSWLTSSFGTRPTLSAWSYPSTPRSSPRDRTQSSSAVRSAIASAPTQDMSPGSTRSGITSAAMGGSARARVLVSDGQYSPSAMQAERGSAFPAAAVRPPPIEISTLRIAAWLAGVWVPLVLSLPYVTSLHSSNLQSNKFMSTSLAVSVAISSPLLVLNLLLRHPIELSHDVFDEPPLLRPILRYAPSMGSVSTFGEGYRRGSGITGMRLVAGHHTTGARLLKSGTIGGKRYRTHFPRVLAPAPRLSISPVSDHDANGRMPAVSYQPGSDWHLVQGTAPAASLPSPPAPTRVASRRRSSAHPHYITPGQYVAPNMIPPDLTNYPLPFNQS